MAVQSNKKIERYIEPLNMNRLRGRMLRIPPKAGTNRELLVVYGHHTSLELIAPLALDLNRYGGVTVPDLPGFGGMQSFYRLREKPTVDNLADYLAAFIKLFYKRRRLTIVGLSFGFVIATRMLQKHPDLAKKVDLVISAGGYSHYEDVETKALERQTKKLISAVFSKRLSGIVAQKLFMKPVFIRSAYMVTNRSSAKTPAQIKLREQRIQQAIDTWHGLDLRTYMTSLSAQLKLNICESRVDLPVHHIPAFEPGYNNQLIEQHLKVIYSSVEIIKLPKRRSTNQAILFSSPRLSQSLHSLLGQLV